MEGTITVAGIFMILKAIAGIAVLVLLALVLKNILDITKKVKELAEKNEPEFDAIIKQLPGITNNVNLITHDVTQITKEVEETINLAKPEVIGLLGSVNRMTSSVAHVADSVTDTTDAITHGIANMADSVTYAVADVTDNVRVRANRLLGSSRKEPDAIRYAKEAFNVVRDLMKK